MHFNAIPFPLEVNDIRKPLGNRTTKVSANNFKHLGELTDGFKKPCHISQKISGQAGFLRIIPVTSLSKVCFGRWEDDKVLSHFDRATVA